MLKLLTSEDAARGATIGLIVVISGLVGQYAAQGMTPRQWAFGLLAIAGSITLAVIVRCWPAKAKARAAE